jgi:hypothetical protein
LASPIVAAQKERRGDLPIGGALVCSPSILPHRSIVAAAARTNRGRKLNGISAIPDDALAVRPFHHHCEIIETEADHGAPKLPPITPSS